MNAVVGSLVAGVAASACCLGPVVFTAIGAGALSAASTQLEPYRPWLLGVTVVFLGVALFSAYRPQADACVDGQCAPGSRRTARWVVWTAVALVSVVATFPYWVEWFV